MSQLPLPCRTNPWGIIKTVGQAVTPGKKSLVKYVEFNITGRCQAGCITCPTPLAYPDEKITKSIEDLEREFENFQSYLIKLKKWGMEFVTLYGREPLLWDQEAAQPNKFLKKMISWISRDLEVKVCLATSGISLDTSILKVLFEHRGVLFMKDWGSKRSVEKLIRQRGAYQKIRRSWNLVKRLSRDYKKARVIAEFLYTGINRKDLLAFWKNCFKNGFLPFVEVPVIKGNCVKNYKQLQVAPERYVGDIYELSLLNLSLRYGLSKSEARRTDLWQPPYGSVFPSPCDKLTKAKGLFLERDGNLSVCCGVQKRLGNINDQDIKTKLQNSALLKQVRRAYENLEGFCAACDYSKEFRLCYGCRGNGNTYPDRARGVFAQDPMCFGRMAQALAKGGKLKKIMGKHHADKVIRYFKD